MMIKWKNYGKMLTYTDKSVVYQIQRHKKSYWLLNKVGREVFYEMQEDLENKKKVCLLEDNKDGLFTYSGLVELISKRFNDLEIVEEIVYPNPKPMLWDKKPEIELFTHQKLAIERMFQAKVGTMQGGTGCGKSFCALFLIKALGLPTVIAAPTTNIAKQLFALFNKYLGKKYVGFFGGGKKDIQKLITVAINASLTRVEPGTPEWDFFAHKA